MQQPVENLPAGRHPNQQQYHQQQVLFYSGHMLANKKLINIPSYHSSKVPPTQQSAENLAAGRQPNQQQYQQQQVY